MFSVSNPMISVHYHQHLYYCIVEVRYYDNNCTGHYDGEIDKLETTSGPILYNVHNSCKEAQKDLVYLMDFHKTLFFFLVIIFGYV